MRKFNEINIGIVFKLRSIVTKSAATIKRSVNMENVVVGELNRIALGKVGFRDQYNIRITSINKILKLIGFIAIPVGF